MGSTYTSFLTVFLLISPAFSRIHPSPIDDAIQPKVSQGHVKHVPAKTAKDVKHHEHTEQIEKFENQDGEYEYKESSPGMDDEDDFESSGANDVEHH
ncbi:hypothetical protein Ddc_19939 [Ditylenchus destructor]|nr:hypothetical protein Ddc_19939 [Ditylenchus destructor]